MIIDCDVSVHMTGSRPRFSRAKVGVGQANGHAYLVVVTHQYKEKLKLIGNCTVRAATLSFKAPNKEVFIKNAGDLMLKAIMAVIKKIVDKKELPKLSKVADIEKQKPLPTALNIKGTNFSLKELNNKCLTKLIVQNLKMIPKCVWNLKNLVELRLTECSLNEIPKGMLKLSECPNLKILDLSRNELEVMDGALFVSLRSLSYLNLSHNQLQFLPFEVFALTHLSELNLSHNKLQYLHYTFARLGKSLKVLNLSNNAMIRFPIVLTGSAFRFNKVDVSGNPFSTEMKQVISNGSENSSVERPPLSLLQLTMLSILKNDSLMLSCHSVLPPLLYRNLQMSSECCSNCDEPIVNMSLTSPTKSVNAFPKYTDIVECLVTSSHYLPVLAFNCTNCKINHKSKTIKILRY